VTFLDAQNLTFRNIKYYIKISPCLTEVLCASRVTGQCRFGEQSVFIRRITSDINTCARIYSKTGGVECSDLWAQGVKCEEYGIPCNELNGREEIIKPETQKYLIDYKILCNML
jgi:hypothetical protein